MTYAIVEGINPNTNGIHGFRVGYVKTQEIIGDHEIVDGNFYFEGKSCVKAKKNILSFIYSTSKSETFGLIQCGNYLCGMKRVERIIYSNKSQNSRE